MFYSFIKAILTIIVKLFFPTKIIGKNNFIDRGCILICNHFSAWDILVVGTKIPYKLFYLSKKELFKTKIMGWFYRKVGGIPVDRGNVSPSTLKEVIKNLKSGKKLLLFPEGTRNRTGSDNMSAIKNGAAMFAILAKVPIIPMILQMKPRPFKRNIYIIGEPLYFDDLFGKIDKDTMSKATEIIRQKMDELKTIADNAALKRVKQ